MPHPKNLSIADFTYPLPDHRIAKFPLPQRDDSKLLIYQNGAIETTVFKNISHHLPHQSFLVFNESKVVPARLLFTKPTGGVIEIFCLEPHTQYGDMQTAMKQCGSVKWLCMVGGLNKWKNETTLTKRLPANGFSLHASHAGQLNQLHVIDFSWDDTSLSFAEIIQSFGQVPLPPYLHREAEPEDASRYQTVYAKSEGSVAAPTAGLHFTEAVFKSLKQKEITHDFVTLHVGAGTFKPVKSATMQEHEMHAEWIDVPTALLDKLLAQKTIVAIGTTTARTLESLYWMGVQLLNGTLPDFENIAVSQWMPYESESHFTKKEAIAALKNHLQKQNLSRLITRTQIIIAPGYDFKIVDGLVTNFHQPQSTLLLLVAALIGDDWKSVYDHALENDFRFLSYGDSSLLWKI